MKKAMLSLGLVLALGFGGVSIVQADDGGGDDKPPRCPCMIDNG